MAVVSLTSFPCSFESGNTYVVTMPLTGGPSGPYDPATWTAKIWLSLNGATPTGITATSSGQNFIFTFSATTTAALVPGDYQFAIYVTDASSERETALTGGIEILPNLAAAITPSFAQAQVTLLETVMAAFNATDKIAVSLNGQSFSRADVATYKAQWTFWKSQTIAENRIAAARRGENVRNDFAPHFGDPGLPSPYRLW